MNYRWLICALILALSPAGYASLYDNVHDDCRHIVNADGNTGTATSGEEGNCNVNDADAEADADADASADASGGDAESSAFGGDADVDFEDANFGNANQSQIAEGYGGEGGDVDFAESEFGNSDAEADADSDSESWSESDADADAAVEHSGNSRNHNDQEIDIGDGFGSFSPTSIAGAGVGQSGNSEVETDVETDVETEVKTDVETEVETEVANANVVGQAQAQESDQDQTNVQASSQENSGGNSTNNIDLSDNSSRVYNYRQVYRAPNLSTQLNTTTSHCVNFIGVQGTGAGENGAGGIGLGIPLADRECRLGKAAVLAFQMQNYDAGWTAFCAQKSVRKSWQLVLKSGGLPAKKADAMRACKESALDIVATRANELATLRAELTVLQGQGYDDSELRRRIMELEAFEASARPIIHAPDSKETPLAHSH